MTQRASTLRLVPPNPADRAVESYRRLADVFHDVLAEESLDAVLDRIAATLSEPVPYDALTIYQADEAQQHLALDNAQTRARLEHQAQTDSLTGLFNHSVFHERLRAALQHASRTHAPVAVLMLDLDDFKRINDVHGHGIGDELLRLLADALRGAVRNGDVVCRLGGEEFAVIMEQA